ncbi:Hypothetical protein HVR_LOCUS1286 [uncultured virus]|nr:Hypothetical protein HVR_LOCUS1286 [uncultured virus]
MLSLHIMRTYPASTKRTIGDISIFDDNVSPMNVLQHNWNVAYKTIMDQKYAKETRNFSRTIVGNPQPLERHAPIYLIPRERGGPSYLSVPLQGINPADVQYCPISKGFPMQDVSSFTLGPIVGEGLCLVNLYVSDI